VLSVGSATPTQPPPTFLQSPEIFTSSSRQSNNSSPSYGGQYTSVEEKTPSTLSPLTSSDQLKMMASSAALPASAERDRTGEEMTTPKQVTANGDPESPSPPPGAFLPQAASMTSLKELQRDTQAPWQSDKAGVPAEDTNGEPVNFCGTTVEPALSSPEGRAESGTGTPKLASKMYPHAIALDAAFIPDTSPRTEVVSQEQGMSPSTLHATGASNLYKKSKNIIWLFPQRVLRTFKKWKNGEEKTSKV
jgi:hypothetical protein